MKNFAATVCLIGALSLTSPALAADKDKKGHRGVSITHTVDDNRGNFWIRSDDLDLQAKWKGQFEFNEAGDGLKSLTGRLEIEHEKDDDIERIVYKEKDGAIEAIYTLNDRPLADRSDEAARISALTRLFILESGMNAEERVADLHRKGGTDAVFAEIAQVRGGHASRKYLTALAELTQLSSDEVARYAEVVTNIRGDHAKSKALRAVFENQNNLSSDNKLALLRAAEEIEGDHDIRKLMQAAASRDLTPATVEISMALLQRIDGDHDYRKGAEALFSNATLRNEDAAAILYSAAKKVSGDHDKRKIIENAGERIADSEQTADAALTAAQSISSDHDKRKSIEMISSELPENSDHWPRLIDAAASISSDHDKRKALTAILSDMPRSQSLQSRYRRAASGISSDHEREKALAALE